VTLYPRFHHRHLFAAAALVVISLGAISFFHSRGTAQPTGPTPDTQVRSTGLPSPSAGDTWTVDRMRNARPAPMPHG
jgi:hypothetical protein